MDTRVIGLVQKKKILQNESLFRQEGRTAVSEFGYSMPRYFQNMPQIGKALNKELPENAAELQAIENEIHEMIQSATEAGKSNDAVHQRGEMTPMERIGTLIDENSWFPLNSIYNPYDNADGSTCVITGLARVHGKWTVVIASDHKKLAGVWVGGQAYKLTQACDTALKLRIPLIYLLNCSGIKLDEQDRVFAGRIGGGTPFYRHMELAQNGIPVLVAVFGTNPAGGGYHAITPTIVIAHEKANMAVGGAGIVGGMNPKGHVDKESAMALINATKNSKKGPTLGDVKTHYNETGLFREVYGSEQGVIESIKKYVDASPAYDLNYFRVDEPKAPKYSSEDLYSLLPMNQKRIYDMKDILARLIDNSELSEFRPDYGPEIICGLAKLGGLLVGIISNYQGLLMNYPEYIEKSMGIGGKLYRQGLLKMNEFSTLCARDRIPVIWFQDTTGIDVGQPAEDEELLAMGAALMYATQNCDVPQMEVTLRKGTGAAHYVMGGPMCTKRNVISIGTAATEMYVMHSETAAAAMFARRLTKDYDAGKDIQPTIDKMNEIIRDYTRKSRPKYCAQMGWVDEIVDLRDLRNYLCAFAGAAYQNPASVCPQHQMLVPRMIRDMVNEKKRAAAKQ